MSCLCLCNGAYLNGTSNVFFIFLDLCESQQADGLQNCDSHVLLFSNFTK